MDDPDTIARLREIDAFVNKIHDEAEEDFLSRPPEIRAAYGR